MPGFKSSSLLLASTLIFSIPILIFASTLLTCSSIYHFAIFIYSCIPRAIRNSEPGNPAQLLGLLASDEQTAVDYSIALEDFRRLNEPYYPFQSSNPGTALHSRHHSRRSSISSEAAAGHGGRNDFLQSIPPTPFFAHSTQISPNAHKYLSTNHGILDSAHPEDGGEWEDVNDSYDHSDESRIALLSNIARSQDSRRTPSPSLRSDFFVGQYDGDVDGVLPTGPRLHFDLPPHPRRESFGTEPSPTLNGS